MQNMLKYVKFYKKWPVVREIVGNKKRSSQLDNSSSSNKHASQNIPGGDISNDTR